MGGGLDAHNMVLIMNSMNHSLSSEVNSRSVINFLYFMVPKYLLPRIAFHLCIESRPHPPTLVTYFCKIHIHNVHPSIIDVIYLWYLIYSSEKHADCTSGNTVDAICFAEM